MSDEIIIPPDAETTITPEVRVRSAQLLAGFLARYQSAESRKAMLASLRAICQLYGPDLRPEEMPWAEMKPEHAQAIRSKLAEKYAPASARRHLSALKGLLREAWRAGVMSHEDYLRAADLAPVKGSRLTVGRALTGAEIDRMFAACTEWGQPIRDRHAAMLTLGVYCGLRRAEIISVEREHVLGDSLRVIGKGNKEREVPLARVARTKLGPWLARRGDKPGPLLTTMTARGGYLTENPLSVSAVVLCLQELAEKAGVTDFSAHDLRRTFITTLLEKGADLRTVQRLAGHDDPMTTTLYDKSGMARAREMVEMLNPKDEA